MEEMKGLELICFTMIAGAGEARSSYVGAIEAAKKGMFDEANKLIEKGDAALQEGHLVHADLIQKEAAGEATEINLLLMHSEDQMMSTELFRFIAMELLEIYKKRE